MSPHEQAVDIIVQRLGDDVARWLVNAGNALRSAGVDDGPMLSLAIAACARPDLFHALEASRERVPPAT